MSISFLSIFPTAAEDDERWLVKKVKVKVKVAMFSTAAEDDERWSGLTGSGRKEGSGM